MWDTMSTKLRGGAAILAGGKSLRMGRDKAMLEIGGDTMLERCIAALQPLGREILVVGDMPARKHLSECRMVEDLYPGAGPVGGIVTALSALGEEFHLIVACDMPFLQTPLLQLLIDAATDEHDAVVPWMEGRPDPLCAIYSYSCILPFQAFLSRGLRAAHRALETVHVHRIEESELRRADPELVSFVNLNTPEDVERWSGRLRGH